MHYTKVIAICELGASKDFIFQHLTLLPSLTQSIDLPRLLLHFHQNFHLLIVDGKEVTPAKNESVHRCFWDY
jgi:hypothetical protein